jgi:hypothetical protein
MPRIISDTGQEIVIEDRPWVLGLMLIAFGLLAVFMTFEGIRKGEAFLLIAGPAFVAGIWFAFGLAIRRTRLTLHADGGATLTTRDKKGLTERHFEPGTLRAGLATQYDDGETYRAILLFDAPEGLERIPLTAYLGSSGSHERVVDRINAWAGYSTGHEYT